MSHLRNLTALAALAAAGCAALGCAPEETEHVGEAASELGQPLVLESEPNGASGQATPIGIDSVARGNVFANGDADYFSFQGVAGNRVYTATEALFSSTTSGDTLIRLLQPDGTTLIEEDDDDGSLPNTSSVIAGASLTQTGTHYIRVQHFDGTAQIRPYDLHFKLQNSAPVAEVEPNGVTPMVLPANGWITGTLSSASDVDIYSLTVGAGDTIFAALDLDPTRDGTEFDGVLALGAFNGLALQVDDALDLTQPDAEAHFVTVRAAGTYAVTVTGFSAGDYHLSVSVHQAAPNNGCTTYTSADVPKTIPAAGGQITSAITVPGSPRIGDVDVSVTLNHTAPGDVDAHIISPAGNTNGIFTDVGNATFPNINTLIDDEAAFPISTYPTINAFSVSPEPAYRLHWLDGENGGGVWTLVLNDDTNNANGGTLSAWSVTICDVPIPAVTCLGGVVPINPLNADFESGAQGFTHSGTADVWAVGAPTAAPINSCNGGTQCFKTNLSGTYSASSNQNLISPPINLTNAKAPIQLRWAMKYQMENATLDQAWVEIREVGGANAKRLWEFLDATMTTTVGTAPTTLQESAGWGTRFADISSYAGKNVEVVFHLQSDGAGQFAGLAVDDVAVSGCPVAVCGNGMIEPGETCDDSNLVNGDGCDSNCTITACGNGIVTMGETCDDKNLVDGDGCDSNCTPTACGNGIKTMNEACDDGNPVEGDGCDSNCTASACGNGIAAPNEGCDDGNLIDGDGCDSNCTMTGCGNGIMTMGEECDDGNPVEGDGCDSNCTITACGNNILTMGEACDDGNLVDDDGCDSNCTPTGCGNGIVTMGEICDDGNGILGDMCDDGPMGNCTPSACGNGVQAGGEGCDDGNLVDGDGCDGNCTTTGCGNGVQTMNEDCDDGNAVSGDGCDNNCTATGCGNGVQTDGEDCDDGNPDEGDGCDTNCTKSACGNSIQAPDEDCDDGNMDNGDGCDSNCTETGCGNGIVTDGEACDDGNDVDGDDCDSNCTETACGNGITTDGEECDDGNTDDGDGCSSTCTNEGTGGSGGGTGGGGNNTGASNTGASNTGGSGANNGTGGTNQGGGCGCRVPDEQPTSPWSGVLVLVGLMALRMRRGRRA